jgi:hypothetical protein
VCVSHKKSARTRYANLRFLDPVQSAGHVVRSGRETLTQYFPCSGGPGADAIKSVSGHVTPNLCSCI